MDIGKVGKQIVRLRKDKGYTQEKLAEMLDVSPQAISKWENGHAMPEITLLPALSQALGTSIDNLLFVSRLQIISAYYGDGIESEDVTQLLNRFVENDTLRIKVEFPLLSSCQFDNKHPKFLIIKYRNDNGVYYTFAAENDLVIINQESQDLEAVVSLKIIAAYYGTAKANYDVMHKIEHYRVFNWKEYHADHERFPSDPTNDDKDYLTFIYLNKDGIHFVSCEEGESIAYNEDRTAFYRKQLHQDHFISNVPLLPEFW